MILGHATILPDTKGVKNMIYYGAKELAASARTVRGNTLIIAKDIPEDKYQFKPVPDYRSVAQLLTHIALSYRFQYQVHAVEKRKTLEGFDFPALMKVIGEEENKPRTKAQVIDLLQKEGETWATWVEGVSDAFLGEMVLMPPGAEPAQKSRLEMILSVKEHEMHHRGQLMTIERLVGVVPHLTLERQARMAQTK
jgi:uncharacterized damage-inducible protein DinB